MQQEKQSLGTLVVLPTLCNQVVDVPDSPKTIPDKDPHSEHEYSQKIKCLSCNQNGAHGEPSPIALDGCFFFHRRA